MNSMSDSEATYCSEVEELMKLTTELNKSCSNVSVRRSQRLSQKRSTGNNVSTLACCKVIHKSLPIKVGCLLTTTQDVFSTQDLREAQELAPTNLTCSQKQVIVSIPVNDEPLNLSIRNTDALKDIHFNHELRKQQYEPLDDLTDKHPFGNITLNGNINNASVTTPTLPKNKTLLGTQKKITMRSKRSQNANSSLEPSNENVKQNLSSSNKDDNVDLQCGSVQDCPQKKPIYNLNNEPISLRSKPWNISKTKGRPRKISTPEKQNKKKRIKSLAKNKNIPFLNANARPNEVETYGRNLNNKNTQNRLIQSILPDVYPAHFKYQLPPEAVLSRPLVPYPTIITPENTPLYELDDLSFSSPSLPDSLRGIFDTDDIKEILNIDKVSYRLYDYHVQALAVILNLSVEYLFKILDKILQMNSKVLKNIDKAMKMPFVEDRDLFATTPEGSPTCEDLVQNSQSPKDRKFFTQTKLN